MTGFINNRIANVQVYIRICYTVNQNASQASFKIFYYPSGQDWKTASSGGMLSMGGMMPQFIVTNMANKDITVEEKSGYNQKVDIQQGDMAQFTLPMSGRKDPLQFKAVPKDGTKGVLINGKDTFSVDPADMVPMQMMVAHEEGMYSHAV